MTQQKIEKDILIERRSHEELVVCVPKHVCLEQPVYLHQLCDSNDDIEKIVIYLKQGAQAILYDIQACKGAKSVQVFLADEAQLSYVYDRCEPKAHDSRYIDVILYKKSFFQGMITITGGEVTQLYLNIHLLQSEATAHIGGFYRLHNQHQCIIKTTQHHGKGFNTSTVSLYGVVEDQASVDYHGLIAIKQDAVGSSAEQVNKSILIGQHAHAKSVPSLEVQTDDVQCKHGTATGQLDDEQLFYLQTRGLSCGQAQKLMLKAFLSQAATELSKQMQIDMYKKIDSSMSK